MMKVDEGKEKLLLIIQEGESSRVGSFAYLSRTTKPSS